MKNPIGWHEQCLVNSQRSLSADLLAYSATFANTDGSERVCVLEKQIARAKREGRDSFDADRFKV